MTLKSGIATLFRTIGVFLLGALASIAIFVVGSSAMMLVPALGSPFIVFPSPWLGWVLAVLVPVLAIASGVLTQVGAGLAPGFIYGRLLRKKLAYPLACIWGTILVTWLGLVLRVPGWILPLLCVVFIPFPILGVMWGGRSRSRKRQRFPQA